MVDVYAKYYPRKSLVDEYMTKKVIAVAPDENLHMILLLIADRELSRIAEETFPEKDRLQDVVRLFMFGEIYRIVCSIFHRPLS